MIKIITNVIRQNHTKSTTKKNNTIQSTKEEQVVEGNSKFNTEIKEVSSFSLASVEKKKTFNGRTITNDFTQSKKISNKNSFTQESLEACWNKYHNIKIQNKEFNIASLLKISSPKKVDNNIEYTVFSDINKKELEDEVPKLLEYIKVSLKNDLIEIKVDCNNSIKKNVIYTPSEKFMKN